MKIEEFLSLICGIGVVTLMIWIFISRRSGDRTKINYDERQLAVRGLGYMKAFYVLIAWICLIIFADILEIKFPVTNTIICFTGVLISSLVLAWHCIMNDAYWGVGQDNRNYIYLLMGLGLMNLCVGGFAVIEGDCLVNGIIQNDFVVFEVGIFVMCIGIFLLIKKYRENRESREE